MSQQTRIFDYFSKLRIYNFIIVNLEYNEIHKDYSRPTEDYEVSTGKKLGVYTWFPYQSSDHCTEVKDITLLDSWIISLQGYFTRNTDLYPRKISNNFKGCPMKAFVFDSKWNFTTKYVNFTYSNGTVVTYIIGLEMKLLSIVLQQMNMTFVHINIPGIAGKTRSNLDYYLFLKKIYIIFGNIGNYVLSNKLVSTTKSYSFMNLRFYVPCSVKNPRWNSIYRIFSAQLWLIMFISFLIAAISTTIVGRKSCTSEWQGYKTLKSSFTNFWAVILGVSVSKMPRTPSLRLLFLAWVFFSLAFNTVFQSFLTTFLTDSGYKTPITNMDELIASDFGFAYHEFYKEFFEELDETETLQKKSNSVSCPSNDICLAWAIDHKNVSIYLMDKFVEDCYARGYLVGENSEPLLCKIEDGVIFSFSLSMAMFHGDPLTRRINEIIDRVVEAGLNNYWDTLQMNLYKIHSHKIAIVHPLDGYYSFNLYHMQPAFYLLLMGWCLSAFCFMVEVFYNRLLRKRN